MLQPHIMLFRRPKVSLGVVEARHCCRRRRHMPPPTISPTSASYLPAC